MTILRCGHSDGYAYKSQGYYRCSRCQTDKRRERRARARLLASLGEFKSDPGGNYAHLADADPIFGDESHIANTRAASQSLLTALYRQHPYVFDAAERSGRMAVRP